MNEPLVPNDQTKTEPAQSAQSPAELRCQVTHLLNLSKSETDPQIKHGLVGCAFALSQLAECIERRRNENP